MNYSHFHHLSCSRKVLFKETTYIHVETCLLGKQPRNKMTLQAIEAVKIRTLKTFRNLSVNPLFS